MKEELKKLMDEFIKEKCGEEGLNPGDFWKVVTFKSFVEWVINGNEQS